MASVLQGLYHVHLVHSIAFLFSLYLLHLAVSLSLTLFLSHLLVSLSLSCFLLFLSLILFTFFSLFLFLFASPLKFKSYPAMSSPFIFSSVIMLGSTFQTDTSSADFFSYFLYMTTSAMRTYDFSS